MRLTIIATAVAMTTAIVLAAPIKEVRGGDSMAQLLDQSQLLPTALLK